MRSLALCKDFDFSIEDHGLPVLSGYFEYENTGEGGGCQGFGYMVDVAFLLRFIEAVGVHSLREVNGKSCWVTHDNSSITKVEPLHKGKGVPFVIAEWQTWAKQGPGYSAYELRTGKKPSSR